MTAPSVLSRNTGVSSTTDATSYTPTLPTITTGKAILVVVSADGNPNLSTTSVDWQRIGTAVNGTAVTGAVFLKKEATGSDALVVASSSSQQFSHAAWCIDAGTLWDFILASANGSSTNSDPPASGSIYTAVDVLWLTTRSGDGTVTASAAPSGYTDLQTRAGGGANGVSTNSAEKSATGVTSENPGVFTSSTAPWVAWTIGLHRDTTTRFSGADRSTSTTLSNSNLTIAYNGATLAAGRATKGWATGKHVLRYRINHIETGGLDYLVVGLGQHNTVLNNYLTGDGTGLAVYRNGTCNWGANLGRALADGDDVWLALDWSTPGVLSIAAKLTGGNWDGNPAINPDTGSGMFTAPVANFMIFPMVSVAVSGENVTIDGQATGHGLSTYTVWDGASGPYNYNVSCLTTTTPVPTARTSVGKILLTTSTALARLSRSIAKFGKTSTSPAPSTLRSASRLANVTTTPLPSLSSSRAFVWAALVSTTPAPSIRRDIAKALLATTSPAPLLIRAIAKALLVDTTPEPSDRHGIQVSRGALAETTPSPTSRIQAGKMLLTNTTPPGSLVRAVAKLIFGSTTPAPDDSHAITKGLTTTTQPAPAENHGLQFMRALLASSAPAPRLVKAASRFLAVTTAPAGSVMREIAKLVLGSTTPTPSTTRSSARTYQVDTTPIPTIAQVKARLMAMQGQTTPTPALRRDVGKQIAAVTTPTPAVRKLISRVLLTAASAAASCSKTITRFALGITTPVPSGNQQRALSVNLQALTAPVGRLTRSMAKSLGAATAATALLTMARLVNLTLLVETTPAPSLRRLTAKVLMVATAPAASVFSELNPIIEYARVRVFRFLFNKRL